MQVTGPIESAHLALAEVREALAQLVHDCIEVGVVATKREGFDVVQRASIILDSMDSAMALLSSEPSPMNMSHPFGAGGKPPKSAMKSPNASARAHAEEEQKNVVAATLAVTQLYDIPQADTPGAVSPETGSLSRARGKQQRPSVSFLGGGALDSAAASPKSANSPPETAGEGQVNGWLQKTFSGYGSFRRASRGITNDLGVVDHALSFNGEGMPALDLSGRAEGPRAAFSRPTARHTAVFMQQPHLFEEIARAVDFSFPELHDIDHPRFDVMSLKRELKGLDDNQANRRVFFIVAVNVFLRYSFVSTYQFRIDRLARCLMQLADTFGTSPFHNALHSADILQAVHSYFCQPNVKENFSDVELFATLFAAASSQLGHLGVTNEFLARVDHSLVKLFGDMCPSENFSAALARQVLALPECNFTDSPIWKEDPLNALAFREIVGEITHLSAPKFHLHHIAEMEQVISNGFVKDVDVPKLLAAVVHIADCRYTMLDEPTYLTWVSMFCEECYQQGDQEKVRALPVSDLCDRELSGTKVLTQIAFLGHIVKPLIDAMERVVPNEWTTGLLANLESHSPGLNTHASAFQEHSPRSSSLRSEDSIQLMPQGKWSDHSGPLFNNLLSSYRTVWVTGHGTDAVHYYAFARLLYTHLTERRINSTFPGHVINLAIKLDDTYIGDRARATYIANGNTPLPPRLHDLPFAECEAIAEVVAGEDVPSSLGILHPKEGDSLPFLVLILRIFDEISEVAESSRAGSPDSQTGRRQSGQPTASTGRWIPPVGNAVYRK